MQNLDLHRTRLQAKISQQCAPRMNTVFAMTLSAALALTCYPTLAASADAEGTPVVSVDVEMHTSNRFSQAEISDIAHYIMTTFANKGHDLAVLVDQQEQGNSYCDLRIDVFLSKAWNPKTHMATAYSLFTEAFNKAKLRKRFMAGGVSSSQSDAWIDDKEFPVLVSDYVNWTTLPAEYLYKALNNALQEIADQVLPEVGPNITKWMRIKKSE
jgi:hypothetical protein